jgi:hypothetical protein
MINFLYDKSGIKCLHNLLSTSASLLPIQLLPKLLRIVLNVETLNKMLISEQRMCADLAKVLVLKFFKAIIKGIGGHMILSSQSLSKRDQVC